MSFKSPKDDELNHLVCGQENLPIKSKTMK